MKQYTILIVEDDRSFANALKDFFEENQYIVLLADNGIAALELYQTMHPDALLMDIDIPEMTGQEVLEQIRRADTQVPIVMMTGQRLDGNDTLKSYSFRADYHLRKPFAPKELLAFIEVLLNRVYGSKIEILPFGDSILKISESILNTKNIEFPLSRREAKLLGYLVKNKNKIIATEILVDLISDETKMNRHQMLKNMITSLKKKLYNDPSVILESVYGKGYILRCHA